VCIANAEKGMMGGWGGGWMYVSVTQAVRGLWDGSRSMEWRGRLKVCCA